MSTEEVSVSEHSITSGFITRPFKNIAASKKLITFFKNAKGNNGQVLTSFLKVNNSRKFI